MKLRDERSLTMDDVRWILRLTIERHSNEEIDKMLRFEEGTTARFFRFGILLTRREIEVLERVAQGYSNAEVGRFLYLSENTIKSHVSRIMKILSATGREHMVAEAIRMDLLDPRRITTVTERTDESRNFAATQSHPQRQRRPRNVKR